MPIHCQSFQPRACEKYPFFARIVYGDVVLTNRILISCCFRKHKTKILIATPPINVSDIYYFCLFREDFNVKDKTENASNLAYTNRGLPFHIDLPFLKYPPQVSSINLY
jgi:hypothetical protein